MDRMNETLALLAEREEWEAEQQATGEFESCYLDKLAMEADAERIAEQ